MTPSISRRWNRPRLRLERLEDRTVPAFAAPATYAAPTDIIEPSVGTNLLAADFNNDAALDLATLDAIGGTVNVLLGNGDGTYQPALPSATGPLAPAWWFPTMAAGDFNGDGNADLAVSRPQNNFVPNSILVLYGLGDGGFQPPVSANLGTVYHNYEIFQLAAGDVNADGLDDIVTARADVTNYDTAIIVNTFLGRPDGALSFVESFNYGFANTLHLADFNEDGDLDVLADWNLFTGNGDGTYTDATWFPWYASTVADFTNDGHVDAANPAEVRPGNGAGGFGSPVTYATGVSFGFNRPFAGDFNGDSLTDMLALNTTPGVTVLLGSAGGALGPFFNLAAPAGLGSVAIGDFNGDGKDDFAATDSTADVVKVFLNDGNWTGGATPPPPSVTIGNAIVTEGNTGTRTASFTVALSSAWTEAVSVQYATAHGTAAAADYQAAAGTLTFAPGETTKTVTVLVTGDRLPESTETFVVNLSNPTNALIADGQGVGTIVDDEPRITINDVQRYEGKTGTTAFTFTVTLSAAYDQAVTVSYRTVNGTATAGQDYTAKTGTITFAPGQTQATITINVTGDKKKEANETFSVELFGVSSNAGILDAWGLGIIVNDD
jgi:hypothetical protein